MSTSRSVTEAEPCIFTQAFFRSLNARIFGQYVDDDGCRKCKTPLFDHPPGFGHHGTTKTDKEDDDVGDGDGVNTESAEHPQDLNVAEMWKAVSGRPFNVGREVDLALKADQSWIADPELTKPEPAAFSPNPTARMLGLSRVESIAATKLLAAALAIADGPDGDEGGTVNWNAILTSSNAKPMTATELAKAALVLMVKSTGREALALRDRAIATHRSYGATDVIVPEAGSKVDWFTKTRLDNSITSAASLKRLAEAGPEDLLPRRPTGDASPSHEELVLQLGVQLLAGDPRADLAAVAVWRRIDDKDDKERALLATKFKDEIKRHKLRRVDGMVADALGGGDGGESVITLIRPGLGTPQPVLRRHPQGFAPTRPTAGGAGGRGRFTARGGGGRAPTAAAATSRSGAEQPATCYNCNGDGHFAANCPSPQLTGGASATHGTEPATTGTPRTPRSTPNSPGGSGQRRRGQRTPK